MAVGAARQRMDEALKAIVVQPLRLAGFRGSLPHLRRKLPDRIDLLTFQQGKEFGRFCVDIARCDPDGFLTHWGERIPPNKVTAHHITPFTSKTDALPGAARTRLAPPGAGDHWFLFGPAVYEAGYGTVEHLEHYERIAFRVRDLIESVAQPFWQMGCDPAA